MYTKIRGSMRDTAKAVTAIRSGDYYYGGGKAYSYIPANFRIEPYELTAGDDGLTLKDIHGHVTGMFHVFSYETVIAALDTLNGTFWIDPLYASGHSVSTSAHSSCAAAVARALNLREI